MVGLCGQHEYLPAFGVPFFPIGVFTRITPSSITPGLSFIHGRQKKIAFEEGGKPLESGGRGWVTRVSYVFDPVFGWNGKNAQEAPPQT